MKSILKAIAEALMLVVAFFGWTKLNEYQDNQKDARAIKKIKDKVCNESVGCSVDGLNDSLS